ncbi:hypothetical protein VCHC42A1_3759, partial [Vibrio cholerae HC-42A1]
MGGGTADQIIG